MWYTVPVLELQGMLAFLNLLFIYLWAVFIIFTNNFGTQISWVWQDLNSHSPIFYPDALISRLN